MCLVALMVMSTASFSCDASRSTNVGSFSFLIHFRVYRFQDILVDDFRIYANRLCCTLVCVGLKNEWDIFCLPLPGCHDPNPTHLTLLACQLDCRDHGYGPETAECKQGECCCHKWTKKLDGHASFASPPILYFGICVVDVVDPPSTWVLRLFVTRLVFSISS
jgi:hypothetical protein